MSTTSTARTSKSQAPTSTLILKGWEEEAGTRMQRWWRLCGKEGHPSRAETFGGGQPEATCKRTREINTSPLLSFFPAPVCPPGRLTKSQRARKPDDKPYKLAPSSAARRWKADQAHSGLVSDPGGHCSVVPTIWCSEDTASTACEWQTPGEEKFGDWGARGGGGRGLSIKYKMRRIENHMTSILLICRIENWNNKGIRQKKKLINTDNSSVVTRGEGGGRIG